MNIGKSIFWPPPPPETWINGKFPLDPSEKDSLQEHHAIGPCITRHESSHLFFFFVFSGGGSCGCDSLPSSVPFTALAGSAPLFRALWQPFPETSH